MNLPSNVNVDNISFGNDEIEPLAPYFFTKVAYSVDRDAQGNGGAVTAQVQNNGAAGDKFEVWVVGYRGRLFPIQSARLLSDAPVHNLTPKPNESDLGALTIRQFCAGDYPVCCSASCQKQHSYGTNKETII